MKKKKPLKDNLSGSQQRDSKQQKIDGLPYNTDMEAAPRGKKRVQPAEKKKP